MQSGLIHLQTGGAYIPHQALIHSAHSQQHLTGHPWSVMCIEFTSICPAIFCREKNLVYSTCIAQFAHSLKFLLCFQLAAFLLAITSSLPHKWHLQTKDQWGVSREVCLFWSNIFYTAVRLTPFCKIFNRRRQVSSRDLHVSSHRGSFMPAMLLFFFPSKECSGNFPLPGWFCFCVTTPTDYQFISRKKLKFSWGYYSEIRKKTYG